jgi:hypothetical protein
MRNLAFIIGAALSILLFRVNAKLVHPPKDIELIFPNSRAKVGPVVLGYVNTSFDAYGFQRGLWLNLTWPNGTSSRVLEVPIIETGVCVSTDANKTGPVVAQPNLTVEGVWVSVPTGSQKGDRWRIWILSYNASWTFIIGTSSHPEQANETSPCGPEPFFYEPYTIYKTFGVYNDISSADTTTLSTQLSAEPTGLVNSLNGARSHQVVGWLLLGSILSLLAVL